MKRQQPDVVLIYFPSDSGAANCIGCHLAGKEWTYSKPVFIPQNEIQDMIREELTARGMVVFDCRDEARRQNPGMEAAVPIIVYRPTIGLKAAVKAEERLHRAVLELDD